MVEVFSGADAARQRAQTRTTIRVRTRGEFNYLRGMPPHLRLNIVGGVLWLLALGPGLLTSAVLVIARWTTRGSRHDLHQLSLCAMVLWGGLAALSVAALALDTYVPQDVTWWALFGFVPNVAGAFVAFMAFAATPPPLSAPEGPQN